MRLFAALTALALCTATSLAGGGSVEIDKYSAKLPEGWKQQEPSNKMRLTQFKVPGKGGDAELAVFFFAANAGSIKDNLERQVKKFDPSNGGPKVEVSKGKFGPLEATFQDVKGTYLAKFPPFDPNAKVTKKMDYQQLYVIFETDKGQYYMTLLGPAETVTEQKGTFEKWVTSFK